MNRYNFVLSFILVSAISTSLSAQKPTFSYGLKLGFNQPFFSAKFPSSAEYTSNDNFFYAGVTTDLRFTKRFSLQTEAFWHKDAVIYYNNAYGSIINEELSYISVPVLAKVHIGKISLYAGPQISFLTNATLPNAYDPSTGRGHSVNVTDSSYKKTRFCAVAGIEWVFKYRFGIDVRYMAGLGNTASPKGTTPVTTRSNRDVTISNLQAGIFFRFGKRFTTSKKEG